MPDEMSQLLRRLDATERNQSDLARQHTEIVEEVRELRRPLDELRTDREVRKERDKHLDERLGRIEKSIASVYSLGKWMLGVVGSALLLAFVTFVVKGGLNVGL